MLLSKLDFGYSNRNMSNVFSSSQRLILGSNSNVVFPHLLLPYTQPPNINVPPIHFFPHHRGRDSKAQKVTKNQTLCQVCSSRWWWLWKDRGTYQRQRGIIRSLITRPKCYRKKTENKTCHEMCFFRHYANSEQQRNEIIFLN